MERLLTVTDFREQCLSLLDRLPPEGIVITRHGKPVARIVPVRIDPKDLIGSIPNLVINPDNNLFTTGRDWDAQS